MLVRSKWGLKQAASSISDATQLLGSMASKATLRLLAAMLQVHYAEINANWTRDVWAGTANLEAEKQWPAVLAKHPKEAKKITLEQFRHYATLVFLRLSIADTCPLCYDANPDE